MISFEKARKTIIDNIITLPPEKREIGEVFRQVLASDIYSDENIPNTENSLMDGFAVRSEDTTLASKNNPVKLLIIDDIRAGQFSKKIIKKEQTIKIMTGAPIPVGADAVVMVENTESQRSSVSGQRLVKVFKAVKRGENIRRAGEDIKKGEKVLKKRTILGPAQIGLLSSIGKVEAPVIKRPKIGIITTGDEIVSAETKKLPKGKVRNSNIWTLSMLIKRDSGVPLKFGTVPDDLLKIKETIKKALVDIDALIISAGISVGEYDYVKKALDDLRAKFLFWKVKIRPGKPMAFCKIGPVPIFCLPGNPVSTFVTYEEFVRPAILKMMGKNPDLLPTIKAYLQEDIFKNPNFRYFIRGILREKNGKFFVRSTDPQGSGILSSISKANCFIVGEEGADRLKKGSLVDVEIFKNFI